MKVIGVADSDSYLKWGASLLERMPADWHRRLLILRTPALPSRSQVAAALAGTRFTDPTHLDFADVTTLIQQERPDVVLVSLRGPVVRVVVRAILAAGEPRPVMLSGLPGISVPETLNAIYYRSQADLLVLHSRREVRSFRGLAERLGVRQRFVLASLPFLSAAPVDAGAGTDIVFAAQAIVPRTRADRESVLDGLLATARAQPDRRVVLKLRGRAGEAQTHQERHPYDTMLAERADVPPNLVVSTGPMSEALRAAGALVTVSSTAAIEAAAAGVPVLAIDDFGVRARLINVVFEGSGLLGPLSDAALGRFRTAPRAWLEDNYFHDRAEEDWLPALREAVALRDAGRLPVRPQFRGRLGGGLRRSWDRKIALGPYDRSWDGRLALAVGYPLREAVRAMRRAQARVRRREGV
ncbi:MAG TPA: DUF6716 putative glycosyltransferase [Rhodoglobus sp.]|nr:DUF6716 putative glycosyltransferase [Rhodoglobus sp.]